MTGRLRSFYGTSDGKKSVMGITGLIGVLFVIGHAAGNLLVFRSPEAMNAYAHFLKSTGELLWVVRGTLVVAVVLHVLSRFSSHCRAGLPGLLRMPGGRMPGSMPQGDQHGYYYKDESRFSSRFYCISSNSRRITPPAGGVPLTQLPKAAP